MFSQREWRGILSLMSNRIPALLLAAAIPMVCLAPQAVAVDTFALRLYSALAASPAASSTPNLLVSPYSIAQVLALAAAGANGPAADEILSTVVPRDVADVPGYFALKNGDWSAQAAAGDGHLAIANGIWTTCGTSFSPAYAAIAHDAYAAATETLDISDPVVAAARINHWVSDHTDALIPRLLSPGDLAAAPPIILINALVFNGFWKRPFDPALTAPAPFTLADGTPGRALAMSQTTRLALADLPDLQLLRLPYAGDELEMLILLPRPGIPLADLESRLLAEWENWRESAFPCSVDLLLPRFDASYGPADLHAVLESLGIRAPFTSEADFSPIGAGILPGMPLAYVLHAARIQVDEKGTKAAAVTATALKKAMIRPQPPIAFHADRPFLYAIAEAASGSLLFIGRLGRPDSFVPDLPEPEPSPAAPEAPDDELSAPDALPSPDSISETTPTISQPDQPNTPQEVP